jgi:signal transduction histidine kinase
MTNNFFPDGLLVAVSLINVVLLLWLGLTVLLNAERRTWGVWFAGGGLLLGAAFFISHSAILGYSLDADYFSRSLNLWWRIGWIPVVALPFTWYVVMLWYAGFWDEPYKLGLPRRQRGWLLLTLLLLMSLVGWLIFASPLPSFTEVTQFQLSASPSVGGAPLFLLIYPLYVILCIGLALSVLRQPSSSERMMGDQARRRARPWLIATSAVLLLVSLLVAGVIGWVLLSARLGLLAGRSAVLGLTVTWFDLLISGLIAIAVVLLGRAIVSYEVFTGKALPRREFKRQWWNGVILAIGYGLVVGVSLTFQVRPIYSLLLTTILMVLFYALLSWRSYTWRERYIRHLRPFVASQRLYEHLLAPTVPAEVDTETPFQVLCEEVLDTRQAHLIALGALAPLVRPLSYPTRQRPPTATQLEIVSTLRSPHSMCIPLEPEHGGGAHWAVPLWSERGLIGVLLLGPKNDDGLYTQEEIEIARASGERLIDTQASVEIAQRLMNLQRQRLAKSQVLDRQTRRILHDDVLPLLHTVLLMLSDGSVDPERTKSDAIKMLTDAHHYISDLLRDMPKTPIPALTRLGLIGALQHLVQDELPETFDTVTWQIAPKAHETLQILPALTHEVLFYAARESIRNAGRHGRAGQPQRPLHLTIIVVMQNGLSICIEDDGVGFETPKSSNGSSGQGLALHSAMLAIIGGRLDVDSVPNRYTRVILTLPVAAIEALEQLD